MPKMEVDNYSDEDDDETENHRGVYKRRTDFDPNDNRYQAAESSQEDQHRYLSNLARGRAINFYINGNLFFPCKKLVYNPRQFRDLSNYMDYLTEKLDPRFGAVRKICTPRHGTRVLDLGELQEDSYYVVAGTEHFKPYRYDKISSSERKKAPPFNYSVDPVYHTRTFLSSGKINKLDTHSLLIKVWPNGGDLKGPRRVLITPRIRPYTLSTVISHVNEILKEDCTGTVEKLYFLTGTQVSDVEQIVQNGQYVACRKGDKFKRARYHEQAVKNIATSPRLDRKLLAPLFPRSVNSTSQSSPAYSSSSTQNSHTSYPHRKKAIDRDDRDDERMFPSKPVKYNRASDRGQTNGFDKDHGEMPKIKDNNRNTKRPKEAADGRYTHRDMSGDRWDHQQENIDDEPISHRGAKKTGPKIQDNPRDHGTRQDTRTTAPHKSERPDRRQFADTDDEQEEEVKIPGGYRGYETRKQRSPPNRTEIARNTYIDQHQDSRHLKPIINNGKGKTVEKPPASNHQITNPIKRRYDVREEEAAITIQAGLRGYQARKSITERNEAATKIQSSFRGYQDRKNMTVSPPKIPGDDRGNMTAAPAKTPRDGRKNMTIAPDKTPRDDRKNMTAAPAKTPRDDRKNMTAAPVKTPRDDRKNMTAAPAKTAYEDINRLASNDRATDQSKLRGSSQKIRQQAPVREDSYEELDQENKAALTIQSHYRGYQTRKSLANGSVNPRK